MLSILCLSKPINGFRGVSVAWIDIFSIVQHFPLFSGRVQIHGNERVAIFKSSILLFSLFQRLILLMSDNSITPCSNALQ